MYKALASTQCVLQQPSLCKVWKPRYSLPEHECVQVWLPDIICEVDIKHAKGPRGSGGRWCSA